jgi:hypothetical protein
MANIAANDSGEMSGSRVTLQRIGHQQLRRFDQNTACEPLKRLRSLSVTQLGRYRFND